MLTRLTDRVDVGPDGREVKVIRYGLWGTTAEIERRGRKTFIVYPGTRKKDEQFRTLAEAEIALTDKLRFR